MDETEITNNEYRCQFMTPSRWIPDVLGEEYVMTELKPDTTVWVRTLPIATGDPLEYYYTHNSRIDDYPGGWGGLVCG
jgi:hypothetical protein